MIKLKEITLGLSHTIFVGDFQFIRPTFEATFSLEEDLGNKTMIKLRDYVVANNLLEQIKQVEMVERRDQKTLKILKKSIIAELDAITEKYGNGDLNDLNHFLSGGIDEEREG